jgi:LysM repeat protein
MTQPPNEEIRIKRGELTLAKIGLVFTALATLVNSGLSLANYRFQQAQAREELAYTLARLDYEAVIECIPGQDDYLVEWLRVTNQGSASAENVQIVIQDAGVEVLDARSLAPYEAVEPRVLAEGSQVKIIVPPFHLDHQQTYQLRLRLAKYGGMDTRRIWEVFNLQKDSMQITTSSPTPPQGGYGYLKEIRGMPELRSHKVERYDTVSGIARKYGLSKDTLIQYNPLLRDNPLVPGQVLVIQPAVCGNPSLAASLPVGSLPILGQHVVGEGESLYCIARAYGVSPWELAEVNGVGYPYKFNLGQTVAVPNAPAKLPPGRECARQFEPPQPGCRAVHVLRTGETLNSVARDYGVDLPSLAAKNDIYDLNAVTAGQRLCIPE